MSWTFEPEFDAAHRAALSGGKHLIYVCPPAAWATVPLLARLPDTDGAGVQNLWLVPETSDGLDMAGVAATTESLQPAYVVTGLTRTMRLLAAEKARTLIVTAPDALELVRRSALKLDALTHVVIVWPEAHLLLQHASTLDTLLAECGSAQRVIATADEIAVGEFLERHARRAPVVAASRPPETPIGPARYALTHGAGLAGVVRAALDSLNPESVLLWDPVPGAQWPSMAADPTVKVSPDPSGAGVHLGLAAALPTWEAFAALRDAARDVVVLVRPSQLSYLKRIAHPLTLLRVSGGADRARDRAFALRAALRDELDAAEWPGELLALAPLFDEYDPALVAAAAARLRTGAEEPATEPAALADVPTWVRIRVDAGQRDRIRTADIVGALLHAVGLSKDEVGRVDVRDKYTVVEIRTAVAERALRGLDGEVLRGRKVAARIDRR